jgi:hypothetical protein
MSFCEGILHVSGGMSQFGTPLSSVITYSTLDSTWTEYGFKDQLDLEIEKKKIINLGDV